MIRGALPENLGEVERILRVERDAVRGSGCSTEGVD